MKEAERKKYKRDLLLVGILLLAAVLLLFVIRGSQKGGAEAVVTLNGEEVGRYPLNRSGTFPLNGGSNILVIENGEAWVSEANCPDKICMAMGKISRSGDFIACLPNRLLIVVEGGEKSPVDGRT